MAIMGKAKRRKYKKDDALNSRISSTAKEGIRRLAEEHGYPSMGDFLEAIGLEEVSVVPSLGESLAS